jgi:hypothetical protein
MLKNLNALIGKDQDYTFRVQEVSLERVLTNLEVQQLYGIFKGHTIIQKTQKSITVRLDAFHKYGIPPRISFSVEPNETLKAKIFHTVQTKFIVFLYYLFFGIINVGFGFLIFDEILHGDGMISVTENGVKEQMSFFPWVPLFVTVFFTFSFFYPFSLLALGWRDSKKFITKVAQLPLR